YNLDLSKRRAAAVQSALQSRHGIAAKQLSAQGYGITRPVQDNQTLEGRAANRRVELLRACPKN
ncbi:MAG: OmpA family protein, partial [Stagnimonas sp.]|nr:OmpA family protein [Stagnimonas sp.]